jgi:hypothetical protein
MAYEEYEEFGESEVMEEAEAMIDSMSDEEIEQLEDLVDELESGEVQLDELSVEEMGFLGALLPGLISAAPSIIGGIGRLFGGRRRRPTRRSTRRPVYRRPTRRPTRRQSPVICYRYAPYRRRR